MRPRSPPPRGSRTERQEAAARHSHTGTPMKTEPLAGDRGEGACTAAACTAFVTPRRGPSVVSLLCPHPFLRTAGASTAAT